jgi:RimJ/RimL family protein N-acetyltransferase
MTKLEEPSTALRQPHEQMLKLIARSFYKELTNYGANKAEILTVAEHLLDNVQQASSPLNKEGEYYNRLFTIKDVKDEWATAKRLTTQEVSISILTPGLVPKIATWLQDSSIRESFYPCFPDSAQQLARYFQASSREYFSVLYQQNLAGIIGAENLDHQSAKLEMRKLVGDPTMHGKGIGKQATFLFLYYVFVIRKFKKVYIHSMDINIQNITINSKFGFELEGVFLEDALIRHKRRDVVRMALAGPVWLALFS